MNADSQRKAVEAYPVRVQWHARTPYGTCWQLEDCKNESQIREALNTAIWTRAEKSPIWIYRQEFTPSDCWREVDIILPEEGGKE